VPSDKGAESGSWREGFHGISAATGVPSTSTAPATGRARWAAESSSVLDDPAPHHACPVRRVSL